MSLPSTFALIVSVEKTSLLTDSVCKKIKISIAKQVLLVFNLAGFFSFVYITKSLACRM